jgi:hypothetical protein
MDRLALGLAVLAAVVVLGWRALRARRREAMNPGRSPETAILATDYGDIDAAARQQRCSCGGSFTVRGEGSRESLRIVRLECRRCERERVMYFDVSQVRH